jgi:hypothetical protein
MKSVILPEVIIFKALKAMIAILKDDIQSIQPEEDKILDSMFNEINDILNDFVYLKQSKEAFKNNLHLYMGYNQEVSEYPSVHLIMNSDSENPNMIGIGQNAFGVQENYFKDGNSSTYNSFFKAQFTILLSSENWSEVVLIYTVIKNVLIMLRDHFELEGLQNLTIAGQDLTLSQELMPIGIYHRSITINFTYLNEVKSLFSNKIIKSAHFKQLLSCKTE